MKRYFILASIANDPVAPGIFPEKLTPDEELGRFHTADEAAAFMNFVKFLASIGYFTKLVLSDEASIARITKLVMDANKNLDYIKALYYALDMAEAEKSDDYIRFNNLAQEAIRYRPEIRTGEDIASNS
ncbi:MAG: hypothetical protein JXR49_02615 [Acidobacteria bacterium]|nr:hypothetical protein [Acidobacteriota bacterium]